MPKRTRYDASLRIAQAYQSFFANFNYMVYLVNATGCGMKTGENHLWYRLSVGEDEVGIVCMEDFDMAKERIVPRAEVPEWMLEKIALLKLAGDRNVSLSEGIGGRVGEVFYIKQDRSE